MGCAAGFLGLAAFLGFATAAAGAGAASSAMVVSFEIAGITTEAMADLKRCRSLSTKEYMSHSRSYNTFHAQIRQIIKMQN